MKTSQKSGWFKGFSPSGISVWKEISLKAPCYKHVGLEEVLKRPEEKRKQDKKDIKEKTAKEKVPQTKHSHYFLDYSIYVFYMQMFCALQDVFCKNVWGHGLKPPFEAGFGEA